ncbi:hypothetical protein GN956_G4350 [Arapaima gigas]
MLLCPQASRCKKVAAPLKSGPPYSRCYRCLERHCVKDLTRVWRTQGGTDTEVWSSGDKRMPECSSSIPPSPTAETVLCRDDSFVYLLSKESGADIKFHFEGKSRVPFLSEECQEPPQGIRSSPQGTSVSSKAKFSCAANAGPTVIACAVFVALSTIGAAAGW